MSRVSQGKFGPARAPWSSWCKTIKPFPHHSGKCERCCKDTCYWSLCIPCSPLSTHHQLYIPQSSAGTQTPLQHQLPSKFGMAAWGCRGLTPITGSTPQSQGVAKGEQRFRHWFTSSLAIRTLTHPSLPSLTHQVGGFACFQLFLDASFSPDLDFFGFGFQTCKAV